LLAITNGRAVHDLGTIGVTRYTASAACARSAFEVGAVAAWLQVPHDPFEREGRWLGWFKANERFYSKLAVDLEPVASELARAMKEIATRHVKWRTAIEAKLPHAKMTEKPPLPNILGELRSLHLYRLYRTVSQIVHGEPDASRWVHRIDYAFRDPEDTNDIAETVGQTLSWLPHVGALHCSSLSVPIRLLLRATLGGTFLMWFQGDIFLVVQHSGFLHR
jgi:hypothetical protein